MFAPLPRLGLIVIDEEHDASFKQDTQPRYHARRVAYQRAAIAKIRCCLLRHTQLWNRGNATRTGHAELISMPHRIADRPLPAVQLVDLRQRDQRTGGAISRPLAMAMADTLRESRWPNHLVAQPPRVCQHNPVPACGYVVACPECDMPLTHHRDGSKAICHYCDYTIATPPWCPHVVSMVSVMVD